MLNKTQSFWPIFILLAVSIAIFLLIFSGIRPLTNPDETRYASVALAMVLHHNYLVPKVNQVIFFDKPPLNYWISAGAIHLFGFSPLVARLGSALFAWLGCLLAYVAGYHLFDRRTGIYAAIILATSLLYFAMAGYVNMDLQVAVCISGALLCFWLGIWQELRAKRWSWLITAYVFVALGVLFKGLMGLVLPMLVIGVWIVLFNQWRVIKRMLLPLGLILVLIIDLPWFISMQKHYAIFSYYFFYFEQFARYVGHSYNNAMPFYFYLGVILLGMFPWSVYIYSAIKRACVAQWQQRKTSITLFLLLWVLVVLIFFSIPQSKIISYILPVFMPLALLFAHYLSENSAKNNQVASWVYSVFSLLCAIALFVLAFGHKFFHTPLHFYLTLLAGTFLLQAIVVFIYRSSELKVIFKAVTVYAVLILLVAVSAARFVPSQNNALALTPYLASHLNSSNRLVIYRTYNEGLALYFPARPVVVVENWQDPTLATQDSPIGHFAWAIPYQPQVRHWLWQPSHFWQQWQHQRLYVVMDQGDWAGFRAQAHKLMIPARTLMTAGRFRLVTQFQLHS